MNRRDEPAAWVVPENVTEEQVAEARQALIELAKSLARLTANVCHKHRIVLDMDDPEVAREVLLATFEAVAYSRPPPPKSSRR